ncbi:hypothetical protein JWG41_03915 [Leptospira sp. 201903075]|uniref:hypothetical protein n=1 Tax=Leptospira chreensis TaxID=2810035 RepID=UPI0019623010|nr:hypothetical protein [Leptospira chreensis]MBM9589576.1 hypothetical protein [Leptospira chreensis]
MKVYRFLLLFSFYFLVSDSIYSKEDKKQIENSGRHQAWIIDCKEKKECIKKCMDMSVFQGPWGGNEYANTIRTECVRSCQQNTICIPEEKAKNRYLPVNQ